MDRKATRHSNIPARRAWAALALAALLLLPSAGALASAADIGELGLLMTLPQTMDVFTRSMRQGDPVPGLYGTTADAVRSSLEARGLWLEAKDIAGKYAVTLEAHGDFGPDYAALGEAELLGMAPGAEVVRTRQAAFVLYEQGGTLVCQTRAGGRLFTLRLYPSGRLSADMASTLKAVAIGMDFGLGQ